MLIDEIRDREAAEHTPGPWDHRLVDFFDEQGRPAKRFEIISAPTEKTSPSGKELRDFIGAIRHDKEKDARLIAAAPELLDVARYLHKACGIQANLNSTASETERSEFISIIYSICNDFAVPAIAKTRGQA